jgi:hypothetical protein
VSPERRHGPRRGGKQSGDRTAAKRSRRAPVSLEDRLKPTTPPKSAATTILPGSPSTPKAEPPSRRQMRQQREEQKRQARRRWMLTAAAVVGVVVLGVLLAVFLAGRGGDDEAAPPVGRTERTLTVTLARETAPASSGALMVYDVDHTSAGAVLIHSRLFVEGSTPQGMPFGETVQLPSNGAPGTSLADTLDVVVDDTWQMSEATLASLVDSAEGVLVDVDVDVLAGPEGGQQQVVVPAGDSQLLSGAEAVAFATYLGAEENEESRLARFSQVLDQVVRRLPADRAALVQALDKAGATDRATLDTQTLADFLLGYGGIGRAGDTTYQTLPVNTLETGGPVPSLVVDPEGLERLHQGLLADSLPPDAGGQEITVLVQNGVGTPGLEQDAAKLLREQGYDFLNGGNASSFGVEETLVLIPDSTPASQALGDDVAATLDVPPTAVKVSNQGSTFADVIVVLGADFKP